MKQAEQTATRLKAICQETEFGFPKIISHRRKDERSSRNDYQTLSRCQPTLTILTYDRVETLRIHPHLPSQFHPADDRPHHDVCR